MEDNRENRSRRNPYLSGDSQILEQERRRARRSRARRRRQRMRALVVVLSMACVALALVLFTHKPGHRASAVGQDLDGAWQEDLASGGKQDGQELIQGIDAEIFSKHPDWTEDYLTPNEYSRPGDPLTEVKNIFVHYTANPGTSAAQNRSYFEQQKDTHQASVSSHFIIGYEGEILQIVPLDEIAYAVMTRNMDSISIECCYKEQNGQFTQETYDSLIKLLKWLTQAYGLDSEDILRHYDCGGKKCPLYYTEHEDAWKQLKRDVEDYVPEA